MHSDSKIIGIKSFSFIKFIVANTISFIKIIKHFIIMGKYSNELMVFYFNLLKEFRFNYFILYIDFNLKKVFNSNYFNKCEYFSFIIRMKGY